MSWWSDVVKWAWDQPTIGQEAGIQSGTTAPATAAASALGGADGIAKTITALWAGVSDGKLWRSLGWLLLGIVLMLLGAAAWIATARNPVSIARKAVT